MAQRRGFTNFVICLIAFDTDMIAPAASNASDAGLNRNRRVELMQR